MTGYGLDGTVNGSLELIHLPKDKIQLISSDNNQVRGTFKAYGHTPTIDKTSWVKFNGPSNNPTINISDSSYPPFKHQRQLNTQQYYCESTCLAHYSKNISIFTQHRAIYQTNKYIITFIWIPYKTNESTPSIMNALTALQLAQSGFEHSGGITNFIRKKLQLTEFGIAEENKLMH